MSALTADRNTLYRVPKARSFEAGADIYAGALVALNGDGKAVPAADTAGLVVVGRAEYRVKTGNRINVIAGCFAYDTVSGVTPTATDIGRIVYVSDDHTVAFSGTSNAVVAGYVFDVDDEGVWVSIGRMASVDPAASGHNHDSAYVAAPVTADADPEAASADNKGRLLIVGTGWTGGTNIATGAAGEIYMSNGTGWVKLG